MVTCVQSVELHARMHIWCALCATAVTQFHIICYEVIEFGWFCLNFTSCDQFVACTSFEQPSPRTALVCSIQSRLHTCMLAYRHARALVYVYVWMHMHLHTCIHMTLRPRGTALSCTRVVHSSFECTVVVIQPGALCRYARNVSLSLSIRDARHGTVYIHDAYILARPGVVVLSNRMWITSRAMLWIDVLLQALASKAAGSLHVFIAAPVTCNILINI